MRCCSVDGCCWLCPHLMPQMAVQWEGAVPQSATGAHFGLASWLFCRKHIQWARLWTWQDSLLSGEVLEAMESQPSCCFYSLASGDRGLSFTVWSLCCTDSQREDRSSALLATCGFSVCPVSVFELPPRPKITARDPGTDTCVQPLLPLVSSGTCE